MKFAKAIDQTQVAHVAAILRQLGQPHCLPVLCHMTDVGAAPVQDIADNTGLPADVIAPLCDALAEIGVLGVRADERAYWYHVTDTRIETLLETL